MNQITGASVVALCGIRKNLPGWRRYQIKPAETNMVRFENAVLFETSLFDCHIRLVVSRLNSFLTHFTIPGFEHGSRTDKQYFFNRVMFQFGRIMMSQNRKNIFEVILIIRMSCVHEFFWYLSNYQYQTMKARRRHQWVRGIVQHVGVWGVLL